MTYFLPSIIDIGKTVGATLVIINYPIVLVRLHVLFHRFYLKYIIYIYTYIHTYICILYIYYIYLLPMVVNHPNFGPSISIGQGAPIAGRTMERMEPPRQRHPPGFLQGKGAKTIGDFHYLRVFP